jgi:hypothetical protein
MVETLTGLSLLSTPSPEDFAEASWLPLPPDPVLVNPHFVER